MRNERKLLSILALAVVSANVNGQVFETLSVSQPFMDSSAVFRDATAAAFGGVEFIPHFDSQGAGEATVMMAGGGAAGDFDRDGDQDIFLAADGTHADRVYLNDGSGLFELAPFPVLGAKSTLGTSVTVGDINRDGWLDVLVSRNGHAFNSGWGITIYMNQAGAGPNLLQLDDTSGYALPLLNVDRAWSAALGDYDLDGDLDLAIATYFPSNTNGTVARLYMNDTAGGRFVDVTDTIAPELNGEVNSTAENAGFAPRFIDMDGTLDDTIVGGIRKFDRYPDLLMAIDFTGPRFYVNIEDKLNPGERVFRNANGSTLFVDPPVYGDGRLCVGGILQSTADTGMGQTVGDYNNDGLMDWYYTTSPPLCDFGVVIHSRLMQQLPGNEEYFTRYADMNECNPAPPSGYMTQDAGWGWAASSVDIDHDGDLDILATNGFPGESVRDQPSYVFTNQLNEQGRFFRTALSPDTFPWLSGASNDQQGRALFSIDKDNDGDLDIVVIHNDVKFGDPPNTHWEGGAPLLIFENQTRSPNGNQPDSNYLRIFLDTCGAPDLAPDGIGTRIEIFATGTQKFMAFDYIEAGSNYNGQDEMSAHFGLASAPSCDVVVYWANGSISKFNAPANQTLHLKRTDMNGSGRADIFDMLVFQDAFVHGEQLADFNGDGLLDVMDVQEFLDSLNACAGN